MLQKLSANQTFVIFSRREKEPPPGKKNIERRLYRETGARRRPDGLLGSYAEFILFTFWKYRLSVIFGVTFLVNSFLVCLFRSVTKNVLTGIPARDFMTPINAKINVPSFPQILGQNFQTISLRELLTG